MQNQDANNNHRTVGKRKLKLTAVGIAKCKLWNSKRRYGYDW